MNESMLTLTNQSKKNRSASLCRSTVSMGNWKKEYSLSGLLYRQGLLGHIKAQSLGAKMPSGYVGRHVLIEASWPMANLNHQELLAILKQAVDCSGMTRLNEYLQAFNEGGFLAAIVIQESHIILHGYADGRLVIDAYTCGAADPQLIIVELCRRLPITIHHSQLLVRGLHESPDAGWCTDPRHLRLGLQEEALTHPALTFSQAPTVPETGWHGIAEYYACDHTVLNSAERMTEIFEAVAEALDITVLKHYHHEFKPQGLSIAFVAKNFHLTMHSWPELYYAPIDLYCTQPEPVIQALLNQLQKALSAQEMVVSVKSRGHQHLRGSDDSSSLALRKANV